MAKKKKHEEHENHERWVISYADFITLLFAFFVVMYGMSSVNEGKYKQLVGSLKIAFKVFSNVTPVSEMENIMVAKAGSENSEEEDEATGDEYTDQSFEKKFQGFVNEHLMTIDSSQDWLEITLKSSLLFESGSARLHAEAYVILDDIAQILKNSEHMIFVEGHTDDVPIDTPVYPSNWELSAARSATVVRILVQSGLPAKQLVAVGYSQFKPLNDNKTPTNQANNRRVVLVISKKQYVDKKNPEKTKSIMDKTREEVTTIRHDLEELVPRKIRNDAVARERSNQAKQQQRERAQELLYQ